MLQNGELSKLYRAFFEQKEIDRKRPSTLGEYRYSLDRFLKFLGDRPVDRETIRGWTGSLQKEGLAQSTTAKHLRNLRCFVRFAADERGELPMKVSVPKVDEVEEKSALTQEQIELVDQYLNSRFPLRGLRLLANLQQHLRFWLVLETGMRIQEALGLKWDRVDLGRGNLQLAGVDTKTGRKREPSIDTAWGTLSKLLARVPEGERVGWVLYSRPGNREDKPGGYRLTYQGYRRYLTTLNAHAGAGVVFHAHDLRRTAISCMLHAGYPIPAVAAQVGHVNWSTTQLYDKTTAQQRVELFAQMRAKVSE